MLATVWTPDAPMGGGSCRREHAFAPMPHTPALLYNRPPEEPPVSIIRSMTSRAGRMAGDVKGSVRRARLEGERRLLERRHRAALEALGTRAYELIGDNRLSADALTPEVAEVERLLMEIDAATAAMKRDDAEVPLERSADLAFPMAADNEEDDTRTE